MRADVRPLLAVVRADAALDPDPIAAYKRSGYDEKIIADRLTTSPTRSGPR